MGKPLICEAFIRSEKDSYENPDQSAQNKSEIPEEMIDYRTMCVVSVVPSTPKTEER